MKKSHSNPNKELRASLQRQKFAAHGDPNKVEQLQRQIDAISRGVHPKKGSYHGKP